MTKAKCQYCNTEKNVIVWVPTGACCNECKKNLTIIRKYKFGIPKMRLTKEKFERLEE